MRKTIFTLVVGAMIFSCTSGGNKQKDANLSNDSIPLEEEMIEEEMIEEEMIEEEMDEEEIEEDVVYTIAITGDLLWEIFTKIPIDSMSNHNLFESEEEYLQAKADGQILVEGNEKIGYHLDYYVFNQDGISTFLNLAGYPTSDGEKIIVVFFIQGHCDATSLHSDQTYEYDLATRNLKPIKRPAESFTFDDFVEKSDFTSKQIKMLQEDYKLHQQKVHAYSRINKGGYEAYWSSVDLFDRDKDLLYFTYSVKQKWNGERFVKERVKRRD